MVKIVTKSSREVICERKKLLKEFTCPECKREAHGSTVSSRTVSAGLFNRKTVTKRSFTCIGCGCQWNTGWK